MSFFKKWYTYQKERFPIPTYGIYILAVVVGTFCYSSYASKVSCVEWVKLIPMFIVAFLQFLMVRIIDEFKDYEEDCKYRPYRPVPRGLITLKELKVLFIICAIAQLGITVFAGVDALICLGVLWLFFIIMSKGFFIKKFLDKHILTEVTLDEILMPVLVLYLSRFVYNASSYTLVDSIAQLAIFLCMSYCGSWLVEIARKVRCKEDEETGVKTYTAVFGIKGATLILFIIETLLAVIEILILGQNYLIYIGLAYLIINTLNLLFIKKQNKKMAKAASLGANLYLLGFYFSLLLVL